MLTITRAETAEDIEAARALMRQYLTWVMFEIATTADVLERCAPELASLPGAYAAPSGCLLLARLDGRPVGCVAFRAKDATTMEVRRMFVSPEARGRGVGGQLMARLVSEAEAMGYRRCHLSTHHSMHAAHAAYRSAGFSILPPPLDSASGQAGTALFMELILQRRAAA